MDEYIKREDAIKAVTYNGLGEHKPRSLVEIALMVAQVKIMEISAADVVEVCRCEDCAYAGKDILNDDMYGCTLYRDIRKGSDFCNYGTRKKP